MRFREALTGNISVLLEQMARRLSGDNPSPRATKTEFIGAYLRHYASLCQYSIYPHN